MAFEQRDNSGSVFENQRKELDTHPDYTGKAMIGGVMYWVNMWVKEKQDGEEYFSFSVKPQDQQQRAPQRREPEYQQERTSRRVAPQGQAPQQRAPQRSAPARSSSGFDDMDDDIPF